MELKSSGGAMDFFTHQDIARRKTSSLVVYFLLAVALIVVAVYIAVAAVFVVAQSRMKQSRNQRAPAPAIRAQDLWNPQLLLVVAGGTVTLIGLGSLFKIGQLRGGGDTVARMLGGKPVDPNTSDLDLRVLLNVVEEMAIAAGTAVPPVYILEEEGGINAFAAGWSPNDAVIGVTRGAVETLTRDELQGVIAHEFSHILNGDMRLNIRLMGVVHGILLIALLGYGLLRGLRHVRISSDNKKGGGGAAILVAMLALGVAFLAIGGIGVFFGRLIKAAVSRQREYLADSSAVQFTRNPGGIAGALKKIGGITGGSRVSARHAEEASHMFFGNCLGSSFVRLLSTHPPLDDRIRRIEPAFEGEFPEVSRVRRTARDLHREQMQQGRERQAANIRARNAGKTALEARAASFAFQPEAAVASVGTVDQKHMDYAAGLLDSLPDRISHAVHEPLGAIAIVYCLLLDERPEARQVQLRCLGERADRRAYAEAKRLVPAMAGVAPEARLPLVEMAIPALCRMSGVQFRDFCTTVCELVEADSEINLFEFALQRMLLRHLVPHFGKRTPPRVKYTALRPLTDACSCLLSTLAHTGQRDARAARRAFDQAAATLPAKDLSLELLTREQCGLRALDSALDRLAAASPQVKKLVLAASAECIHADGRVTVEESELLRVVADSLDCPMPPLLA